MYAIGRPVGRDARGATAALGGLPVGSTGSPNIDGAIRAPRDVETQGRDSTSVNRVPPRGGLRSAWDLGLSNDYPETAGAVAQLVRARDS